VLGTHTRRPSPSSIRTHCPDVSNRCARRPRSSSATTGSLSAGRARPATLAHGQSLNNPLLNEIAPKQALWIHPDRAKLLGIADGDEVEISGGGRYSGFIKANVTRWIHPEAVFMLHGYGATVPLATRARGVGVADQRLQHGKLYEFDPAGGGNAMTETIVQIKRRAAGGAKL